MTSRTCFTPDVLYFQKKVIEQSTGLKVTSVEILHLNSSYVRNGELDLGKLFVSSEVSKCLLENEEELNRTYQKFLDSWDKDHSLAPIGKHCTKPRQCQYYETCFNREDTVLNLRRSSKLKWQLFEAGIKRIEDISPSEPLTSYQMLQFESSIKKQRLVDFEELSNFLNKVNGRIASLDFESFNCPYPLWHNYHAYQHVVFQASIHKETSSKDGLDHKEFLWLRNEDPSKQLAEFLISNLKDVDVILVYYASFEISRLKELSRMWPHLTNDIESIISKIIDLEKIFSSGVIVDYRFQGSTSIKKVLGIMCPDFEDSYEKLDMINNGMLASISFYKVLEGNLSPKLKKKIKDSLSKYCFLDTLSLFMVLQKLEEIYEENYRK